MDKEDRLIFSAQELAETLEGKWVGDIKNYHPLRVTYGYNMKEGDLSIVTNEEQWLHKTFPVKSTEDDIKHVIHNKPSAMIVRKKLDFNTKIPYLVVDDTYKALENLSQKAIDKMDAKRVLITGTEGKTGFKLMSHYLIEKQVGVNAFLDSANLNRDIWKALASVRQNDEIALVEASADINDKRNRIRYNYIKPHIAVITNISPIHMTTHKTIDNVIKAKALCVESLVPGGICIVNCAHEYAEDLLEKINQYNDSIQIVKYGYSDNCDSRIIEKSFDQEKMGWSFKALINKKEIDCFVPMLNEYAPLSVLSVLTLIDLLGLDIFKAAKDVEKFVAGPTAGRQYTIGKSLNILVNDHSFRSSEAGLISALEDMNILDTKRRKIGIIANINTNASLKDALETHKKLTQKILETGFDILFLFGEYFKPHIDDFSSAGMKVIYVDDDLEIFTNKILDTIKEKDLIFIKAQLAFKFNKIVESIKREASLIDNSEYIVKEPYLYYNNTKSKKIVVSFASANVKRGVYDNQNYYEIEGYDSLKLNCTTKEFYFAAKPKTGMLEHGYEKLLKDIRQKYEEVICIGSGMGGYGALYFGNIINANRIIAFSPEITLNTTKGLYWSHNKDAVSKVVNLNILLSTSKIPTTIFWGEKFLTDISSYLALSNNPNIDIFTIKNSYHYLLGYFKSKFGSLNSLINSLDKKDFLGEDKGEILSHPDLLSILISMDNNLLTLEEVFEKLKNYKASTYGYCIAYAWLILGKKYYEIDEFSKALEAFKKAIRYNKDPEAYLYLAWIYEKLQDNENSKKYKNIGKEFINKDLLDQDRYKKINNLLN